jgi:hypothetical protein
LCQTSVPGSCANWSFAGRAGSPHMLMTATLRSGAVSRQRKVASTWAASPGIGSTSGVPRCATSRQKTSTAPVFPRSRSCASAAMRGLVGWVVAGVAGVVLIPHAMPRPPDHDGMGTQASAARGPARMIPREEASTPAVRGARAGAAQRRAGAPAGQAHEVALLAAAGEPCVREGVAEPVRFA